MSMASDDVTVKLLENIRDELRGVNQRIDVTNQRIDATNAQLDVVESTLLDVVAEQRLLVRHTRAASERELELEARIAKLETK